MVTPEEAREIANLLMWFGSVGHKQNAENALRDLASQVESLRADAERYRWLVENSFDKVGVTQFHVWKQSWEPHSKTGEPTEWTQRIRGPVLDAAIDEARKQS